MTLGTQWAWKPHDRIKSAAECIRILVQCASGDGNLLLNVGPMPDGEIEPRQAAVLEKIGLWLTNYGQSIYGTRGGPFRGGIWGGSTRRGNVIYLHILHWRDTTLILPPLGAKIRNSSTLTGGRATVVQQPERIIVHMPREQRDSVDSIIQLEMDRPVDALDPVEVRAPISPIMNGCTLRLTSGPSAKYPGGGAPSLVDGVRASYDHDDGRWLGFEGDDVEALIHLQRAGPVRKVVIGSLQNQGYWVFLPRSVEVAVSEDGNTFLHVGSTNIGEPVEDTGIAVKDIEVSFPPVTARYVKIRVVSAGTCPPWHAGRGGKAWVFLDEVTVE
jgi:alpha-L-fucosidase